MSKLTISNSQIEDHAMSVIAQKSPGDAVNLFVCTVNGVDHLIDEELNYKDHTLACRSKMIHYILTQEDIDAAIARVQEVRKWNKKYGMGSMVTAIVGAIKSN